MTSRNDPRANRPGGSAFTRPQQQAQAPAQSREQQQSQQDQDPGGPAGQQAGGAPGTGQAGSGSHGAGAGAKAGAGGNAGSGRTAGRGSGAVQPQAEAPASFQFDAPPLVRSEPRPPFPAQHQDAPGLEARLDPPPRFEARRYRAAGKLLDKRALITGGDSGIGRAVAVLYAREGADVAITYLPEEQRDADDTRAHVEATGRRCLLLPGDLSDPAFCDAVIEQTVQAFGGLDVLVSNAAHQTRKESLEDLDDAEMIRTFEVNVFAYMRLVRAALTYLQPGASIIASSSETGLRGSAKLPDYSASKGAINALTKSLAQQLIERGIRVNAVAPGPVWTPLNPADAGMTADKVSHFGESNPMGRPAQPEELAPSYVYLASDADSSYVTGIVLQVMGGETMGG